MKGEKKRARAHLSNLHLVKKGGEVSHYVSLFPIFLRARHSYVAVASLWPLPCLSCLVWIWTGNYFLLKRSTVSLQKTRISYLQLLPPFPILFWNAGASPKSPVPSGLLADDAGRAALAALASAPQMLG